MGVVAIAVSLSLLAVGCQLMRKTGWLLSSNPYEQSSGSAAQGEAVYVAHCASCHGASGFGDGDAGKGLTIPPRDLRAYIADYTTAHFAAHVAYGKTGNPDMPSFLGVLTKAEIWHVTNYVFSLGPAAR